MSRWKRSRRGKRAQEPAQQPAQQPVPEPVSTPAAPPPPTADAEPDAEPDQAPDQAPAQKPDQKPVQEPVPVATTGRRQPGVLLVLRAAHPRQAILTAAAMAGAAAATGRAPREIAVVGATVLVGQAMLGWHNDLVDRRRDRADERQGKPVADGRVDPGTIWFVLACAALLVVPLSISSGVTAGAAYLAALVVGLLGNVLLRRSWLSWLPWAVSFALYPAYLSYGGWGGEYVGDPPEISVTVLAAALGVCVHVLRSLPGLVADNRNGMRHLPLRIALRIGAPRLLYVSIAATALVAAGLALVVARDGLSQ